jgi:hypothetical protein
MHMYLINFQIVKFYKKNKTKKFIIDSDLELDSESDDDKKLNLNFIKNQQL